MMNEILAITGDWHLDNMMRTYLIDGIPNREKDIDKQVKKMLSICLEKNVTTMIVAGDMFEKSKIDGYYYSKAVDYLRSFSDEGIRVIVIPGNHDANESGTSITMAISKLRDDNIEVFEERTFVDLYNGQKLLLLPHEKRNSFKDFGTYSKYINSFIKKEKSEYIVVGHFQPVGSSPGSEENMFAGSTRFLDTKIFGTRKVFAGHVHKRQELGNTYIPGSLVRFDIGDRKEAKGFYIYNNGEISFEKLSPQKIARIEIDLVNKDSYSINPKSIAKYKGSMVWVKVNVTKESKSKINYREILSLFENVGAKVISYKVDLHHTEENTIEETEDGKNSMSPENVLKRMVKKFVKGKVASQRILKIGIKTLGDCYDTRD